jgi:hypothetical protein
MNYALAILICTIEGREEQYEALVKNLKEQIRKYCLEDSVTIVSIKDNRVDSVGKKRNQLIQLADADYICFVDDDDKVSDDYVCKQYTVCMEGSDCGSLTGEITFEGLNPKPFIHSLDYTYYTEDAKAYYRPPNHLNVIKREIAMQVPFPEISNGEDTDFSLRIRPLLKTETKTMGCIYHYLYSPSKTATQC